MNGAHFHLLVNHLPIVGVLMGLPILLGGMIFKSPAVKRVALLIFVFCGVTALLSNVSGEGAERVVEDIDGISHRVIHRHEEMGEKFFMLSVFIGLLSIVTFYLDWKNKPAKKYLYIALTVLLALNVFLGVRTGLTGGEIRHSEINTPSLGENRGGHELPETEMQK